VAVRKAALVPLESENTSIAYTGSRNREKEHHEAKMVIIVQFSNQQHT
jgi:hypothetical protein